MYIKQSGYISEHKTSIVDVCVRVQGRGGKERNYYQTSLRLSLVRV